ncbi:MAG: hypothetical protein LIR50_15595 [Bacillota bacterium]|nr:hypothetical protein [Bacillota bacterium]
MAILKKEQYTSNKYLKDIYNCAMNVSRHGIGVPSNNPWGYSWIDFELLKTMHSEDIHETILNHIFDQDEINEGIGDEEFNNKTLKDILTISEGKFRFGIDTYINWEEDNL